MAALPIPLRKSDRELVTLTDVLREIDRVTGEVRLKRAALGRDGATPQESPARLGAIATVAKLEEALEELWGLKRQREAAILWGHKEAPSFGSHVAQAPPATGLRAMPLPMANHGQRASVLALLRTGRR